MAVHDTKSAPQLSQAPQASDEKYDQVVQRLEGVVSRLEGGTLSLEDSLKAFEEGIGLVRSGERMLSEAEKRIEQLLSDGEERVAPLDAASSQSAALPARPGRAPSKLPPKGPGEEDIPF